MCFSDISSLLIVFWFIIALELENTALAVLERRIFQGEYAEESLLLGAHLTQVGSLPFLHFAPHFASIPILFIKAMACHHFANCKATINTIKPDCTCFLGGKNE